MKEWRNLFPLRRLPGNDDPPKSVRGLLGEVIVALNHFEALPSEVCFDFNRSNGVILRLKFCLVPG